MSPRVLGVGDLIFWFHSYDARFENRASVHVGKSAQNDFNDAKIWLEPEIEVARSGRVLKTHDLNRALKVIVQNRAYLLEAWYEYRGRSN